jgi:hypothetical protein
MITAVAERVRNWLRAMPRWPRRLVVVVILVAAYGITYPAVVFLVAVVFRDPVDWSRPAGPFIGGALGTGLTTWWQSRRMGGADRVQQYERAVKTKHLPDDADPAVWRPLLAGQRCRVRRLLAAGVTLGAVLEVVLLLLTRGRDEQGTGLVVAAALLAGLVGLGWAARRQVRTLDRLADQLPGTDPASAA